MTTWSLADWVPAGVIGGPLGLEFASSGDLYVADYENRIWKVTGPGHTASVFAGSGAVGHTDDTGTAATFTHPSCLAFDASGNLYVGEWGTVRKITPAAVVTTIAGSFNPSDLAGDASGNVYLVEYDTTIRKITPAGAVTTLATVTGGELSTIDYDPASGDLFVTDMAARALLRVTLAGVVTTLATFDASFETWFGAFESGVLNIAGVHRDPVTSDFDVTAWILRYDTAAGDWLETVTANLPYVPFYGQYDQFLGIASAGGDVVVTYQFSTQVSGRVLATAVLRTVGGTFASPGGAQVHLKQEDGTWPVVEDIS